MTANRRHTRRTASIAAAMAAAALTASLVSGCDSSTGNSAACFPSLGTIAASLIAIHQAGLDASNDPSQTAESITVMDENLAKIGDKTDNAQLNKAVEDLDKSIADYNQAILNGDTHPDTSAITNAANEFTDVCTS